MAARASASTTVSRASARSVAEDPSARTTVSATTVKTVQARAAALTKTVGAAAKSAAKKAEADDADGIVQCGGSGEVKTESVCERVPDLVLWWRLHRVWGGSALMMEQSNQV